MKMLKRVSSLVLALMLVLSLSVAAFAVEKPSVTYDGHKLLNFNSPDQTYTFTDLFGNFKGVMPGDTLTETIPVRNNASCCDYVKIYMYALPHDPESNDIHNSVAEDKETVASMEDFLSQLHMTVTSSQGNKLLFDASPDQAAQLEKKVLLGAFAKGQGTDLVVTLEVPLTLGNEYAFREGEVDWVFVVEEYIKDAPQTGDHNNAAPAILFLSIGVAGMLLLMVGKRKKKQA